MSMLKKYSNFASHKPYLLLIIIIFFSVFMGIMSQSVGTKVSDNRDILPDGIETIEAFNKMEDNFGGSESIKIVIEVLPENSNSGEIQDVRDYRVVQYSKVIAELSMSAEDVISSSSAGTIISELNNNIIPKNQRELNALINSESSLETYISRNYKMSIVSVNLNDEFSPAETVDDLHKIIDSVPIPPGVTVTLGGEVATEPIVEQQIGPDIQRTGNFAMIGIILLLFLTFFSIRYALTPLVVIGLGMLWTMGFLGVLGEDLSSITSSAISMIMGIGIDFGIQTVNRFRQEREKLSAREAMEITINKVFIPMLTTTLAALIGFRAMAMGKLTILKDLGIIMSYGVFFCFVAAITVIPVVAIISDDIIKLFKTNLIKEKQK